MSDEIRSVTLVHISDCTLRARRELFVPGCALVWHCTKNREYGYVESLAHRTACGLIRHGVTWIHHHISPIRWCDGDGTVLRFPREMHSYSL